MTPSLAATFSPPLWALPMLGAWLGLALGGLLGVALGGLLDKASRNTPEDSCEGAQDARQLSIQALHRLVHHVKAEEEMGKIGMQLQ